MRRINMDFYAALLDKSVIIYPIRDIRVPKKCVCTSAAANKKSTPVWDAFSVGFGLKLTKTNYYFSRENV